MRLSSATVTLAILVAGLGVTAPAGAEETPRCRGVEATIVGTEGDDRLVGTDGDDVIVALGGLDSVSGGEGDDLICGGESVTRFDDDGYLIYQGLYGGPGDDRVFGGSGSDRLDGDTGRDVLRAAGGNDDVYGNAGRDRLWGGLGDDHLEGNDGADLLRGNTGDDELVGTAGDDAVRGGAGDDVLYGGAGDDLVDGGPGRDAAAMHRLWKDGLITDNRADVTADLRKGTARSATLGRDRLRGIEDVWTGSGEDTVVGDRHDNVVFTGEWYRKGRDVVRGGGGSDTLSFDPAISHGCCSPLWVDLAKGAATWGKGRTTFDGIENVVAQGDQREVILGDRHDNVLTGRAARDDEGYDLPGMTIRGRGGDDTIVGSARNDALYGGPGDDALQGLGGNDLLDGGTGTNTIDGGLGSDTCLRPGAAEGATRCET